MSTPCFGTITGIALRNSNWGSPFISVGDEVEVLTFGDAAEDDPGIRVVESITIDSAWAVVRVDAPPHFAVPLADIERVWMR